VFLSADSIRNVPKSAERIPPEFNQRCTLGREEEVYGPPNQQSWR